MSIASAAISLVVALIVLILGLAAVKVMERHGWRPVDRLADLVSSEPANPLMLAMGDRSLPPAARDELTVDDVDD